MTTMRLPRLFLLPSQWLLTATVLAPLLVVVIYSLLTRGAYGGVSAPLTFSSYSRVFQPIYLYILWRSIWVAALSTALCLVLAFPIAFYIARAARHRTLLLNLVMLPFWTSFLVRTYAWMFLLRDTGLLNTTLQKLGLVHQPLPLLFNVGAVLLGLVYGYLPFMILPLYATLDKLDGSLLEAALDLGATPADAIWRIAVPLSRPGILAGSALVFIPCLGAYLTPDLMGGGKTVMIGNLVQNQFTSARDWPFGAALSLVFLALSWFAAVGLQRRGDQIL